MGLFQRSEASPFFMRLFKRRTYHPDTIHDLTAWYRERYPLRERAIAKPLKWDGVTWIFEPPDVDRRDRSYEPREVEPDSFLKPRHD